MAATDDTAATDEQPKRRGRPPSGGREAILDATLAMLRERGVVNLTSRDVAARAGVSDASVYYHFRDRAGLILAAFEHGMEPLRSMMRLEPGAVERREALRVAAASLERFFDGALPLFYAAQADEELRAALASYIDANNLGPHKGVQTLGAYLRAERAAGRVRADADVEAVALLLIDSVFARVVRRQMLMHREELLPPEGALLEEINRLLD